MSGPGERLADDDARILALESGAIRGHTMKLLVLEPAATPLDLEPLRASVAGRLGSERRARQRIDTAAGTASWVEDEEFDVARHVRRLESRADLDEDRMRALAGELMSERLDHSHPLWSIDLIGPLADGREAIAARIHHAMADGISCMRFLERVLWDRAAGPDPAPPRRAGSATSPSPPVARRPLRRLPGALGRELGGRAPDSPLDRRIGARRELAFAAAPLAELHGIGTARPGHVTVNDVLLAMVAGGLRRWLGDERAKRMRAQVPVSLHHRDEGEGELGNRDSFLNIDLPLDEPDPLRRLARINAETAARKQLGDAEEIYDFFHALARFHHLSRAAQRLASGPREFSLSISNVPGPREPIRVTGRAVQHLCSFAEPADRHALRVSAVSCAGTVEIGLCSDPDAISDLPGLAAAIDAARGELRAAAIG